MCHVATNTLLMISAGKQPLSFRRASVQTEKMRREGEKQEEEEVMASKWHEPCSEETHPPHTTTTSARGKARQTLAGDLQEQLGRLAVAELVGAMQRCAAQVVARIDLTPDQVN
jgi:hypothetical protein